MSPASPRQRLVAAIEQFLDALGLPPEVRSGPHLAETSRRVAEAWSDDLLDGYRLDAASILSEAMPASGHDLVVLTGIDYHSMCPHHLLPSRGVAHVAYVPGDRVVGFGQLARLVDCFAHRLVLEEDLARSVADALVEHLGARGAACALDAEQMCLTVRGERRSHARAHAQALAGAMQSDRSLQRRFMAAIAQRREASTAGTPGAARATTAASGAAATARGRATPRSSAKPARKATGTTVSARAEKRRAPAARTPRAPHGGSAGEAGARRRRP